jgi:hypothetical protein
MGKRPTSWGVFDVQVGAWPPSIYTGRTAATARWAAFENYRSVYCETSFREFLHLGVRVTRRAAPPVPDGYDYIRRAYGIEVAIGNRVRLRDEGTLSGCTGRVIYPGPNTAYVHVLLDGENRVSRVHPSSIEPEEAA